MIYELKTIIARTFSKNEVSIALVNVKSHLTSSSEPAIRICGEESNRYIYQEKNQKIDPGSVSKELISINYMKL